MLFFNVDDFDLVMVPHVDPHLATGHEEYFGVVVVAADGHDDSAKVTVGMRMNFRFIVVAAGETGHCKKAEESSCRVLHER
jgi:D-arabinose 1-dehydrogenase-like Zn-dependent alcohol dehydrogenase